MGAAMSASPAWPRPVRALIVSGSSRANSNVAALVRLATETLEAAGAQTRTCDLAVLLPPVFVHDDRTQDALPAVHTIRADAAWADALLLVTPEYHGNMSGALKNWFDFLYLQLAGKLAAAVAVTGGGGGDMSLTAVERCMSWCHGFCLPYRAAAKDADFDEGRLTSEPVRCRVQRIAHDLVRYAAPLRATWETARKQGPGIDAGVAGLHHADPEQE